MYRSWLSEDDSALSPDLSKYALAADMLSSGEALTEKTRQKVVADWRAALDSAEFEKQSHVKDRADSKAELPKCAKGLKLFTRQCGHRQAVIIRCGRPTCPECERIRSAEAVARWSPVIAKMKHPKMLVLAVVSSRSLDLAGDLLEWCFGRFMDLRIGGRNREKYRQATRDFIDEHAEEFDKHHKQDESRNSAEQWRVSCERFWSSDLDKLWRHQKAKAEKALRECQKSVALDGRGALAAQFVRFEAAKKKRDKAAKRVQSFEDGMKVRDLLFGIRPLEITWNPFSGWHPHYHLAIDSIYLPFPAVLVMWMQACQVGGKSIAALADPDEELEAGETIGRTAHISALKDAKEVLKYVTKHVDHDGDTLTAALPTDRKKELEEYLKGKKRIWPIGNAKPAELPKAPCPGCGDGNCKCDHGQTVTEYCAGDIWKSPYGEYMKVARVKGKGLTWARLVEDGAEGAPFSSHIGDCLTVAGGHSPGGGP